LDSQGSIANVVGSGRAIISDSSIRAKPSIEEPSNPIPSPKARGSSFTVMVKPFKNPSTSVNHNLIYLTLCSWTNFIIADFVLGLALIISSSELFLKNYLSS